MPIICDSFKFNIESSKNLKRFSTEITFFPLLPLNWKFWPQITFRNQNDLVHIVFKVNSEMWIHILKNSGVQKSLNVAFD